MVGCIYIKCKKNVNLTSQRATAADSATRCAFPVLSRTHVDVCLEFASDFLTFNSQKVVSCFPGCLI